MKKNYFKISALILLLALCLTGCAGKEETGGASRELKEVGYGLLPEPELPESLKMADFMCAGRACIAGDMLFTMDFDAQLKPVLGAYSLNDGSLSGFNILLSGCEPEYLQERDGRLYYINRLNGSALESISCEGRERQILDEGPCDFLQLSGDRLYYCGRDRRLRELGPEGSRIILPEACYYPYILDGVLIYQRASDEHLRLLELNNGSDTELTDLPSYAPVIWDGRLYCTVSGGIFSMNLEGLEPLRYELYGLQGEAEYYSEGGELIIHGAIDHGGICSFSLKSSAPKESFSTSQPGCYRHLEFAGEEYSVFAEYEAGGRLRQFILRLPDGGERAFFAGSSR